MTDINKKEEITSWAEQALPREHPARHKGSPFQSSGSPAPDKAASLRPLSEVIGRQPEAGDTAIERAHPILGETEEETRDRLRAEKYKREFGSRAGDTEWKARVDQQLAEQEPSAAEKAQLVRADKAAEKQKAELKKLDGLTSLDWKQIPPPMLAQVLIQIPFKGSGTDPDYYLQPWQAMIFALRCFELGLSPFSNEVWFNPKNNKVNVTFEGKLKLARTAGLNLSPPLFERLPPDAAKPLVAYKCTIVAPHGKCEYTATLKEWMVPSSPVWKAKPDHMLQLRAAEKCLSFATGSGSSELMGEQDLQTGKEVESFIPSFTKEGK